MGLAPSGKAFGWITLRRMRALWWEFERQSPPVDENLLHTQARQIVLHRNAPGSTVCLQNHNTLEGDSC